MIPVRFFNHRSIRNSDSAIFLHARGYVARRHHRSLIADRRCSRIQSPEAQYACALTLTPIPSHLRRFHLEKISGIRPQVIDPYPVRVRSIFRGLCNVCQIVFIRGIPHSRTGRHIGGPRNHHRVPVHFFKDGPVRNSDILSHLRWRCRNRISNRL